MNKEKLSTLVKKTVSVMSVIGILGTSSIVVFAANNDNVTSGMKELSYNSSISPRITEYAGGGTWDHGISIDQVWSNYYHGTKIHGSTAENTNGQYFSGWKDPGVWSYKSIKASLWGNKVYWKVN